MKFKIAVPGLSRYSARPTQWDHSMRPQDFQRVCRHAEALGYDSVFSPEHIVVPPKLKGTHGPFWPHALTAMAFFAGATERIRVDSNVLVLPYHHPVVFAKAVATLDMLSGGRVNLTMGVGHSEAEFDALGISFAERGRIADEAIEVMKLLWSAEQASFAGRYSSFRDIYCEPKPVQKPHPPLWIGGDSKPAMRRAVRMGDGWAPSTISVEQLPGCLEYMKSLPEWSARAKPLDIVVSARPVPQDKDHKPLVQVGGGPALSMQELVDIVGRCRDAGVTWTRLPIAGSGSLQEHLDLMQQMSEEVVAKFR